MKKYIPLELAEEIFDAFEIFYSYSPGTCRSLESEKKLKVLLAKIQDNILEVEE